ncbi:DUF4429 domain-containing protein [Streptomyces violascens]|uniref:DUF4429 domain-containing protein n=1 Tax=Streptomyces violascens TaxID=67381 RepID=UPI001679E8F3|nr:DUF4429 domain-containing protein [Streptomyces violascens]
MGDPLKAALRIRRIPLAVVTEVRYEPPTGRRRGSIRLVVVPGTDPLRPLLRRTEPGPDSDPDTLVISHAHAVQAATFAEMLRARLTAAGPAVGADDAPWIESGVLPIEVSGSDGRVSFDGTTVGLRFGRLASPEKRRTGRRDLPLEAIADVRVEHPGFTGWLHFALAGTPVADPGSPRTDLNTLVLNADRSESYAILGAAVLAGVHRTATRVHAELLAPCQPSPSSSDDIRPERRDSRTPTQSGSRSPSWAEPTPVGSGLAPADRPRSVSRKERRAAARATKDYAKALVVWEREQRLLDELVAAARRIGKASRGATHDLFILKANETVLWTGRTSLVEPRRRPGHYSGGSSGVRLGIAKGVSVRVGASSRHYTPGPEVQTPVDRGTAMVTTQRVVFKGPHASREWAFPKLLGVESATDGKSVLLPVSNRQKVSGLLLGDLAEECAAFLALGLAVLEHGPSTVTAECMAAAERHRGERPSPPSPSGAQTE